MDCGLGAPPAFIMQKTLLATVLVAEVTLANDILYPFWAFLESGASIDRINGNRVMCAYLATQKRDFHPEVALHHFVLG